MHDLDGNWFNESTVMLQKTFDKYNVIPRKGDYISCDVGDAHKVDYVQWIEDLILIVVEHNEHYQEYRERLKKNGFSE